MINVVPFLNYETYDTRSEVGNKLCLFLTKYGLVDDFFSTQDF